MDKTGQNANTSNDLSLHWYVKVMAAQRQGWERGDIVSDNVSYSISIETALWSESTIGEGSLVRNLSE